MFTLSRIIGVVPIGALQPTELKVIGIFACPPGTGGIPMQLRFTNPAGAPSTIFTATTSTGGAMGPVETVVFTIPAWAAALCGTKIGFEVQGYCNQAWTAWEPAGGIIDCLQCPRINLQTSYGACSGTPPRQDVTLTATVMLPAGTTMDFLWDFGDGAVARAGTIANTTGGPNTPFTLTVVHAFDASAGPYTACLKPPKNSECPEACATITPDCNARCCDEVTVAIATQPLPCIGTSGSPVSVQFTASLTPAGCTGTFEWKVTNLSTNTVLQAFAPGGASFSYSFPVAGSYKVNVRVPQDSSCDDPWLTDSVTLTIAACPPCAVSVTGPTQTACTDAPPTAPQTFTATTAIPFAGPFTWEVVKAPAQTPLHQSQGGTSFSFAFPGPGTYTVTVSLQTSGCANPTAASSVVVVVPPCTTQGCPPGQHRDSSGNCVPDAPSTCPPGQHLDSSGNCVPDMPPGPASTLFCDGLLWAAVLMLLAGAIAGLIACMLVVTGHVPESQVALGVAIACGALGALVYAFWWAVCRFLTACATIIAVVNFLIALIFIFAIATAVLGVLKKLNVSIGDCWLVALATAGFWGVAFAITYKIGVAVGCIIENAKGPRPSGSSSSPLSSSDGWRDRTGGSGGASYRAQRPAGLGDAITLATSAIGIRPCAGCHERAARLNRWGARRT